jgi:methylated-DNA-[protein]-cysteine S-methyltransferase
MTDPEDEVEADPHLDEPTESVAAAEGESEGDAGAESDETGTAEVVGGAPDPADHETGIYARESPYLERYVQIGLAGEKLINVSFPGTPNEGAEDDHPLLDRLFAYLEGTTDEFQDVDIALTVPTEQRTVLEALRNVPHGEDVSVERLTRMAGLDGDDEANLATVREALSVNPVPVVVPDHRVPDGPSSAPPRVEQRLRSLEGL